MKPPLYIVAAVAVALLAMVFAAHVAGARAGSNVASRQEPGRDRRDRTKWTRDMASRLAADISELSRLSRAAQVDPSIMRTPDWRRSAEASRGKLLWAVADLTSMTSTGAPVDSRIHALLLALDDLASAYGKVLADEASPPAARAAAMRRAVDEFNETIDRSSGGLPPAPSE